MYVANTHLKPVIGIDIHFVNLPFPFVPLPHPYIGLVIDPFDYIPFIGATVKVNGVPRGNTDTAGMIITFVHIPFGAGFTIFPIIGHDSQNFFGSKKVLVDGAPMSGAGYMLMTCNDIGLPLSFRPGRKFIPIPSLYLPTSFCIPLQWGKPVMVGGPLVPNFSLMALLKAFALGSFLKIFGKIAGKLLRVLNKKVLSRVPATAKLNNRLCRMGFEPVDLITGRVNYEYTDFELPGPIPLRWTRNWDSDSGVQGMLGHGVYLSYDRCIDLWPEDGALSLSLADGRLTAFPLLQPGEQFYHPQEKLLLRRKQNGHFLLEDYNDSLYYHFNHETVPGNTWRLSFIENYNGNRIQLHYTGKYLSALTDSAGRRLLLQLDNEHRITKVEVKHRDVRQTLVSYNYNEEGDLITIGDALVQEVTIEYNDHLMVKKTDRNGQTFYWEYDHLKRCLHTWGDGGVLEGFIEYGKGYNLVTNSLGEETTLFYDENNLCVQETDHYGNHRYIEYTEDFELYREIDEEGHITGYVYDKKGRLKEKLLPDGNSEQYNYNSSNQLTMLTNPDGSTVTYGYDLQCRLSFINYPNGQTVAYEYNEEGQLDHIVANGNQKTTLRYDEDENLISVQLPNGGTDHWKYDALGNCVQAINTAGLLRYYEYDPLGRVTAYHLPDGNSVQLAYNAYEDIVQATDKFGEVRFEYTTMGHIKKRVQGNAEIAFLYDTEERVRSIVNEAGRHYAVGYNKRGELISETGFDGLRRSYERDATGRLVKTTLPGNRQTRYEHDVNGRLVRIEHHDGSWLLFGYDKTGNLKEATNEHSTIRLTRNKFGYVEKETQDQYTVLSEYDKLANRVRITSSLGADIHLQRNELGLVAGMQVKGEQLLWDAQLKYNAAGHEIERSLPGGLISEMQYDHAGRPGMHKVSRKGIALQWKKYTWDAAERLTHTFDALAQAGSRFKHDALGNLIFAQYADNRIMHRAVDKTGNLYETTERNDRIYNAAGALLQSEKYAYEYDDLGRLITKIPKRAEAGTAPTRYEWYADGQLKKVIRPDGKIVSFTYDALGRRITKTFNGIITRWVWDRDVPLHEWTYEEKQKPQAVINEWGTIEYDKQEPSPCSCRPGACHHQPVANAITWIFDVDRNTVPCAKIQNGVAYSIIADYLGTPVAAYDHEGKRVWETALDIYGRAMAITGDKNFIPFRYQGQYEDAETGLYYNRFRYYAPGEGTYISQDPISVAGGLNTYAYVTDPNAWVDEFGLSPNPISFTDSHGLTLEVHNYVDISHLSDAELKALYYANDNALKGKGFGLSGTDKQGNTIVLHHYRQNPNGPIIAMPQKHHDKPHTNPGQHPFGKRKGGGLTANERTAFNRWKQEYWKHQASTELTAREVCH
jgi:RHS repeat-associated protein